ncbi:MAG: hypothetical protein ABEJ22_02860 [Haloferacaceae archaeon]
MAGRSDRPPGDPAEVRSIAVRTADVVTALELCLRSPDRTVLRLTPPYAPRMRARLHRPEAGEYDERPDGPRPTHVDPESLVAAVPPYPEPDETARDLRERGEYSTEAHHERHRAAVATWRDEVACRLVDDVVLETPDGPHRVSVTRLG